MAAPPHGKQDDSFFQMLALEVVKDYGRMPLYLLDEAITNGIKGVYTDGKNVSVTSISIYSWISERVQEYRVEQAKKHREEDIMKTIQQANQ